SRREARTAARLHHTNVVPVFGVGEQDGVHYLAMQLIRGAGLDVLLAALRRPAGLETPGFNTTPVGPREGEAPAEPLAPGSAGASPSPIDRLARLPDTDPPAYHRA